MPEVTVEIGGRAFEVACQDGEQAFVEAAARMLDVEASALVEQVGRLPESRMLLMAGLMLADRTGELEDRAGQLEQAIEEARAEASQERPPERVEVPVIPAAVTDALAELTARAEALADEMEATAAASGR